MIEKADFESNRKGGRSDPEVSSIFNHFKSKQSQQMYEKSNLKNLISSEPPFQDMN